MTIVDLLKHDDYPVIIRWGDKWLYWDEWHERWCVAQRKKRSHTTQILMKTRNEEAAVKELIKD